MSNSLPPYPYGNNAPQHTDIPPLELLQPAAEVPEHSHRLLHRLGSVAALAGTAATLYVGIKEVDEKLIHPHITPYELTTDQHYELPKTQDMLTPPKPGPEWQVENDITKALSVDTCETKVTTDEVMHDYDKLFGHDTAPSTDSRTLNQQAVDAVNTLQEAGNKLDFADFPGEAYDKLRHDAFAKSPSIPLSEYRDVLTKYAAQLGLDTLYTWDGKTPNAPGADRIRPVDTESIHSDVMARQVMVNAISGLSFMPKSLIAASGAKRVVFGDIVHKDTSGEVFSDKADILIDIADNNNSQIDTYDFDSDDMRSVITHEDTHQLHNHMCWSALSRYVGEDDAMRSLNAGAIYKQDLGKAQPKAKAQSLNLGGAPGEIVSINDYGQTDASEDVATIGAVVFYGPDANQIFLHDTNKGQDLIPLKEKVSLLLARVEKKNPELAAYYMDLLQVGRMQAQYNVLIPQLADNMNQIYNANKNLFKGSAKNPVRSHWEQMYSEYKDMDYVRSVLNNNLTVGAPSYKK